MSFDRRNHATISSSSSFGSDAVDNLEAKNVASPRLTSCDEHRCGDSDLKARGRVTTATERKHGAMSAAAVERIAQRRSSGGVAEFHSCEALPIYAVSKKRTRRPAVSRSVAGTPPGAVFISRYLKPAADASALA